MNLECEKEKLCVNKFVKQIVRKIELEQDIIIPDSKPDILSYVGAKNNVCISKIEINTNSIKVDGTNDVCISYVPDSNVDILRCIDSVISFNENIEVQDINENMFCKYEINTKVIECKILNGRKIRIKLILELKIEIYEKVDIELLKDIKNEKNVQSLVNNISLNAVIGTGIAKTIVKDNFKIPDNDEILDIIRIDYNIINKDYKISYNKVLGKADLEVKILYLSNENKIKQIIGTIPIMEFVNLENVAENDKIDMIFRMRNFNTKINNGTDHTIFVECDIELVILAYRTQNLEVIKDLYIPNKQLKYNSKLVRAITNEEVINKKIDTNYNMKIENIKSSNIKSVELEYRNFNNNLNILNTTDNMNELELNGEILLDVLGIDNDNKVIDILEKIPFNFKVLIPKDIYIVDNTNDYNIRIEVIDTKVTYNDNSTLDGIEFNINLEFKAIINNIEEFNLIDDLEIDNDNIICNKLNYSLVIYFVKEGDTLWKIAKKFNTTVDEITNINEIKDENLIYPRQQLFIPRFVCI